MRKNVYSIALVMFVSAAFLVSCNKAPKEYIADDASFTDFMSWVKEAEFQGPDPALGAAHGGNDSTVIRKVYYKDGQDLDNDNLYPVGTIIVKHSSNGGAVDEYTAMVKRGNDFSPTSNDWEWFVLNSDGTIAEDMGTDLRGANLMNGMCVGCHTSATNDYSFTK